MIYTNLVFDIGSSQEILTRQRFLRQIVFEKKTFGHVTMFWLTQTVSKHQFLHLSLLRSNTLIILNAITVS